MNLKDLFKKRIIVPKNRKREKFLPPYEQRTKTYPLSLIVTIINRHQDKYFIEAYADKGAAMSVTLYASSNPPQDIMNLLGFVDTKKDIILTVARSEYVSDMLKIANNRFKVSQEAKGIAFSIPVTSVAGIITYRFLADQDKEARLANKTKEE